MEFDINLALKISSPELVVEILANILGVSKAAYMLAFSLRSLKQGIYFIAVKKNSWEHIQLTILNIKKAKDKNHWNR